MIITNKVVLIGRLTADPELKYTPGAGAAVCSFTLAVDRKPTKDGKKEADFPRCTAWNKTAENIANYMSKGSMLGISGRLSTKSYEDKEGNKRSITEVVVDEAQFLDNKKDKPKQEYEDMENVSDNTVPF